MVNKKLVSKEDSGNKVIGRKKEILLLRELFASNRAEFIAIYGRRRVGKTYLIKHLFSSLSCIFFHATGQRKGSLKGQLSEFAKQVGEIFYHGAPLMPYKSWNEAFEGLRLAIDKIPKNRKVVVFLDEFPWMATPRSGILSALELYWNRYWNFDNRLKLIICGSATSWIIENIINNVEGLYQRVTRQIHLTPFVLDEVESYLKENRVHLTRKQMLDLYFVLGGVPLYWSFVRKGKSAHQVIDELCFQSDGPLVKEFRKLFESLFKDPVPYIQLIRRIAKHRYGIGQAELLAQTKQPQGGRTAGRLHQLEESGFITTLLPFGRKDKGIYYLVDDEYSLFYLYWIEPNLRIVNKKGANPGFWLALAQKSAWTSWAGLAFEAVCYKHLPQIRRALNIHPGAVASSWRMVPKSKEEEGAQIDLLFDSPDETIILCEIKWCMAPFVVDKACAGELQKKMEVFKSHTQTNKQILLAMITTSGLKPTLYSEELVSREAKLEDFFVSD